IMKRIYLLILINALAVFTCAPKPPLIINNIRTAEHENIPGTKLSIIPPEGFAPSGYFIGFLNAQARCSIMVTTIPEPVVSMLEGFTADELHKSGINVKSQDELLINDHRGRLFYGEQTAKGAVYYKYLMIFGDGDNTFVLAGTFPKEYEDKFGEAIKTSLLSTVYEPDRETDPRKTVNFEIDESKTKLKFAGTFLKSLMYTVDGKIPTKAKDKTMFFTAQVANQEGVQDKKLFSMELVKQAATVKNVEIKSVKPVTIDGISGYEIIADAKDAVNLAPVLLYHVSLYSDELYYYMMGIAYNDYDANIRMFKVVCRTFKRR
ncbi:MAG: hypothetical protein P8107_13265, partial [Spirochaetia bacterium]